MPYVTNVTPFQGMAIEHRFYNNHPYDCFFVKATFRIGHEGSLLPLRDQPKFVVNDVHEGDDDRTALAYPSDIIPVKTGTDVLIIGSARLPHGEMIERWLAQIEVFLDSQREPVLSKTVQLTGPWTWVHGLTTGWTLPAPQKTNSVRLSYALAYGGASASRRDNPKDIYPPNPFGRGYLGRDTVDEKRDFPAAQILTPKVVDIRWNEELTATGLSPVDGAQWARLQYAGTYDEQWEREVKPNIPLDMKLDFWNAAPADQVVRPYLKGGELVRTVGLFPTESGALSFRIPDYDTFLVPIRGIRKYDSVAMNLDTVIIDLDKRHVTIRWATLLDQDEGYSEYELVSVERRRINSQKAKGGRQQ